MKLISNTIRISILVVIVLVSSGCSLFAGAGMGDERAEMQVKSDLFHKRVCDIMEKMG